MPHDDILAEIGADWRRQTVDYGRLRARIAKRQRRTKLQLAAKIAGTAFALLAGCWFVFLTVDGGALAFGFGGLILIAALPLMVMEVLATKRLARIGATNSPEGALRAARDQAIASFRLLWAPRAVALVLGMSSVGLVMLHVLGEVSFPEVALAAPIWLVTAAIAWLWQKRRARRLQAEIARCDLMLKEIGRV